mmetsp:Transcript_23674/g.27926  ORF Transcript_23674/g.27926 Transcript_23674/m.27926 type:complete len:263 (+) Transcript_23674:47-835(+)|eukprot:CAMPEP_0198264320 /NCGR_PEP_ID=MMETSP1447-20131203/15207_1 /TAXON_ID=420782 /ORGANISM="Chaetoceros dichaeta, Strain CCMP1751" /LENGTH=262 /DNA_ID=CAMNT_0043953215 /DNA_START=30 /DNA_END=818 /DNA_ORIENTATION=-
MSTTPAENNGKRKADDTEKTINAEKKTADNVISSAPSTSTVAKAPATKKKKTIKGSSKLSTKVTPDDNNPLTSFKPLTLVQIRKSIIELSNKVPKIPPGGISPDDKAQVKDWATQMQAVVEEFNLLLCCVAAATYKWGTDRTGAADQNLTLLSSELGNAQDQISSSVTPRLTNVLAPVVDLVTSEIVIKKNEETGEETRTSHFSREEVDPNFLRLCAGILCRNAKMLRIVVLTNFQKIGKCIDDYVKATTNDGQNGRNAFSY